MSLAGAGEKGKRTHGEKKQASLFLTEKTLMLLLYFQDNSLIISNSNARTPLFSFVEMCYM